MSDSIVLTKSGTIDDEKEKNVYWAKRNVHNDEIDRWRECNLVRELKNTNDDGGDMYLVEFTSDGCRIRVMNYELASDQIPKEHQLIRGTRVIARREGDKMPYIINSAIQKSYVYKNESMAFYPGILSGHVNIFGARLVFFDDGMVQYLTNGHIRRVLADDGYQHAHWNAKAYFEFMLRQPNVIELAPTANARVKVELNGNWTKATVREVSAALMKIQFDNPRRCEWIYVGSPRISQVYRSLIMKKAFDKLINYKTYMACLRATNDIPAIKTIKKLEKPNLEESNELGKTRRSESQAHSYGHSSKYEPEDADDHECDPDCLSLNEQTDKIEKYTALMRPGMVGWTRNIDKERSYYCTPCGKNLRTYNDIHKYLVKTNSKLRIDCFELNPKINLPTISLDIKEGMETDYDLSNGLENIPIVVRGAHLLMDFVYITEFDFEYVDEIPENNLQQIGCDCKEFCRDKTSCSCWQLTVQLLKKEQLQKSNYQRYTKIGYKNMRLLNDVTTGIVECNSNCKCCANQCYNRVVQHGIQHKLEVVMTDHKGRGVITKSDLPEGVFVCQYVGKILDEFQADRARLDYRYQFRLPVVKVKDNIEENASEDSETEVETKIPRLEKKHQEKFLNYFPPMENGYADNYCEPDFISQNRKRYLIDAISYGNIARFLNHSCDPNLFTQKVYVGRDKRFPMIGFFTKRIIKADEELTFDYAYEYCDSRKTKCYCGSKKCRKRLM